MFEQGGEIVGEWVGLRPTRDSVRVEKEYIHTDTGVMKVQL